MYIFIDKKIFSLVYFHVNLNFDFFQYNNILMSRNIQQELDLQSSLFNIEKPLGPTFWAYQDVQGEEEPLKKQFLHDDSQISQLENFLNKGQESHQLSQFSHEFNIQEDIERKMSDFPTNKGLSQNQIEQKITKQKEAKESLHNPEFKKIFKTNSLNQKSGNVIRFFVDLAINYLPKYKDEYSEDIREDIIKICTKFKKWHLEDKKNVYKLEDICKLFSDEFELVRSSAKKSRKIFSEIIQNHTLQAMKKPKSQIRNKVHYLRVAKLYRLRCRNNTLSQRIQSR